MPTRFQSITFSNCLGMKKPLGMSTMPNEIACQKGGKSRTIVGVREGNNVWNMSALTEFSMLTKQIKLININDRSYYAVLSQHQTHLWSFKSFFLDMSASFSWYARCEVCLCGLFPIPFEWTITSLPIHMCTKNS